MRLAFGLALILLAAAGAAYGSDQRIMVEKMDLPALDAMIADDNTLLMIVVMAAWCPPCREELPVLIKLFRKYRSKGLNMVGLSVDFDVLAMQPFMDKVKINFPVYWAGEEALSHYQIASIPQLLVVKEGQITERIVGKKSERFLNKKIKELLKKL